jgi:hypothetical protein
MAGSKVNNPIADLSAFAANSGVNRISIAEFAGIIPEVNPEIYSLNPLSIGILGGGVSWNLALIRSIGLVSFDPQDVIKNRIKRRDTSFAAFIIMKFDFTVSEI